MRAIGEPLTAEESAAMIAAARKCVADRVRFRRTGRNPAVGLDCSGLLVHALTTIGRPVIDRQDYGKDPHKDGLRQAVEANLGQPAQGLMQAGDVVLMTIEGAVRHVGLVANHPQGGLSLIHAYGVKRRVVEHGLDKTWRGRIVAVYRP